MTVNWIDLLLAYLHDPPDKALSVTAQGSVPGHESRGPRFAQSLIGDSEASRRKMKKAAGEADMLASIIKRLPMPKEPSVNVKNSRLPGWRSIRGGVYCAGWRECRGCDPGARQVRPVGRREITHARRVA